MGLRSINQQGGSMPTRVKKRAARRPARSPKAKTKAKARAKKTRTLKAAAENLSPAEVAALEQQAAQQAKSETAWLNMTAPPPGDDRWSAVEENMLDKDRGDSERRWKYFAK